MRSALFLAAILVTLPTAPQAAEFPRPAGMEHQIRFWRDIFTTYSKYQVVIHDTVDLDKVYKVLDYTGYIAQGWQPDDVERIQKEETAVEMDRLRALFRSLHEGTPRESLSEDDRRIADLFRNDRDPYKYLTAASDKRLRSQRGISEKFADGYRRAKRYFPEMERIFREEGLPVELTRLPLIESCFNEHAYSKVGAAGVWQFMPSTGRLFMEVNNLIDERKDPIASTRGAAQFLRRNYDMLGSWPLAITAYNHGPGGMARAVRETGTDDIGVIVERYDGPAFGFASRNFYAEFLAAVDIDRHHQAYFGPIDDPPVPTRARTLDGPMGIEVAARLANTDVDTLAAVNPALLDPVTSGRHAIPAGYRLRLPNQAGEEFDNRVDEFVAEERVTRVSTPAVADVRPPRPARSTAVAKRRDNYNSVAKHRVKKGQTLSLIAKRYRVSEQSLRIANGLGRRGTIKPGQVLRIPRAS